MWDLILLLFSLCCLGSDSVNFILQGSSIWSSDRSWESRILGRIWNTGFYNLGSISFAFLKRMRNWSLTTFQHYIGFSSHYIHTCRRKKGETEIEYRDLEFYTATLVLLRARSSAPIHGTDILRPHPTDEAKKVVSLVKDTPHPAKWLVPRVLKSAPLPLSYRGYLTI